MRPRRFHGYRLLERLGVGGWAEVWRAVDERSGETVAVKRLHRHVARDPAARARLRREAEALTAIRHPGIVRVRELVDVGDDAALVLDHVDGEPLSEVLARGGLRRHEAIRLVRQVAEALAAAHAAGIVHRDVKPANVLVDAAGDARLIDFGIARAIGAEGLVTGVGSVVGTLRYLPPEVLRGEPATPASDVWALGAVAYELIERHPPFEGVVPAELVRAEAGPPPAPDHAGPALGDLLLRALDPDPAARPQDAGAFLEGLDAIAAEAPTVLVPASAPTVTFPAVAAAAGGAESIGGPADGGLALAAGADDAPVPVTDPAVAPLPARHVRAAPGRLDRRAAPRRLDRRAAPATIAALVLVAAFAVLAAGPRSGGDGDPGAAAIEPAGSPSAQPAPTAAPEVGKGPAGGNGEGNGKGNGKGKGKDH